MSDSGLSITDDHLLLKETSFLHAAYRVFLNELQLPAASEASLVICLPDELRSLNRRFRGTAKYTDVLSFPSGLFDTTAFTSGNHASDQSLITSGQTPYLGEILIDINYIFDNAGSDMLSEKLMLSTQQQSAITEVCVHGLLHLL